MIRPPTRLIERAVMLDTSAVYALYAENDQWHARALEGLNRISQENRPVYITNLTVAETHALMRARLGDEKAVEWLHELDLTNLILHAAEDHKTVTDLLQRNLIRRFSYVDAFSCVAMERVGIRLVFTFDRAFQDYGWEVFPESL